VTTSTHHTNRRPTNPGSDDERWRPPPVEVPLDNNESPRRRAAESADAPRLATRRNTIRRTIVILAVGAIGGFTLAQGLAHPNQSTVPTSTTTAPVVPAEQPQEELRAAARPSGDTVTDLIAGLDAITQVQIAHAATTDSPQQAAVTPHLRQQHDDVRNLILTYYYGWLPYPHAVTPKPRQTHSAPCSLICWARLLQPRGPIRIFSNSAPVGVR
jgi:hypothetical protein